MTNQGASHPKGTDRDLELSRTEPVYVVLGTDAIEATDNAGTNTRPSPRPPRVHSEYYEIEECGWCLMILGLVGSIIFAACLASSFHYVKYDQYALLQNKYGTVSLSPVYGEGRYFLPLNYEFVIFPSNNIEVSIEAVVFSETGLQFEVDIFFYYRLPKENIGKIFNQYSQSYNDLVISNAKTTIKNTAAPLLLDNYFYNRTYVERLFANAVATVLAEIVYVDVDVDQFMIRSVVLPDQLLTLSLHTEITTQTSTLLELTQQVKLIEAETNTMVASITAETSQLINFAENRAGKLIQAANSYYHQVEIRARAEGIAHLLQLLHFDNSNSSETTSIIRTLALLDNSDNTTVISTNGQNLQVQVSVNGNSESGN